VFGNAPSLCPVRDIKARYRCLAYALSRRDRRFLGTGTVVTVVHARSSVTGAVRATVLASSSVIGAPGP
jgi:hypothetical protein